MKMTGKGKTLFVASKNGPIYTGRESHVNQSLLLFGSEAGPAVPLIKGSHKFDFELKLDSTVPSSMQGYCFSNKYKLELEWIGLDLTSSVTMLLKSTPKVPFKVIRHEDLNDWHELNYPVEKEQKVLKDLALRVQLPKAGFTPGENIPTVITFTNESSRDVELVQAKMKEVVELGFNGRSYKDIRLSTIASVTSRGVKRGDTERVTVNLKVPNDVIPSSTVPSNIMLRYELEVTAHTDAFSRKQTINIPITIGSVPFRKTTDLITWVD